MIKVSVIMTTYNGEAFVSEQLESICSQTMTPDEILIFDDRSSDDTVVTMNRIIERYSEIPIKLIVNQQNLGWQKNFYYGINQCNGEYIFIADQDDIWEPKKIERMIQVMEERPDIQLLASNYDIVNNRMGAVNEYKYSRGFVNDSSLLRVEFSPKFYFVCRPGCTYCIRKELFLLAKKSWVELLPHDELLCVYGVVTNSFYILNESLIRFRRHNNNASGLNRSMDVNERIISCETQRRFIENVLNDECLELDEMHRKELQAYVDYQKRRIGILKTPSVCKWINVFIRYYRFHFSVKSAVKDLIVAYNK